MKRKLINTVLLLSLLAAVAGCNKEIGMNTTNGLPEGAQNITSNITRLKKGII